MMLGHSGIRQSEEEVEHPNSSTGWIRTHTGRRFTFNPVDPDQINTLDIAHALSHICRFNGHVSTFHSVAQHSLLVAEKMPGSPKEKLAALFHDAAETYVCDIPSPLKHILGEPYLTLHDNIQDAIFAKLGITDPPTNQIKLYDKASCLYEAEAFFCYGSDGMKPDGWNMDLRGLWTPWDPHTYRRYLQDEPPEEVACRFLLTADHLQDEIRKEEQE